jgi:hypothetical protein
MVSVERFAAGIAALLTLLFRERAFYFTKYSIGAKFLMEMPASASSNLKDCG